MYLCAYVVQWLLAFIFVTQNIVTHYCKAYKLISEYIISK